MKSVTSEYPMYYGAKPDVLKKAKELRKQETKAEKILWNKLNKNQLMGFQFRRQHPLNHFIADFYCHDLKLVIEVDGGIHQLPENNEYDIERSEILSTYGIKVIRFSNDQVMKDIDNVIQHIKEFATSISFEALKSPASGDLGGETTNKIWL